MPALSGGQSPITVHGGQHALLIEFNKSRVSKFRARLRPGRGRYRCGSHPAHQSIQVLMHVSLNRLGRLLEQQDHHRSKGQTSVARKTVLISAVSLEKTVLRDSGAQEFYEIGQRLGEIRSVAFSSHPEDMGTM